jgi:hypothetical protein
MSQNCEAPAVWEKTPNILPLSNMVPILRKTAQLGKRIYCYKYLILLIIILPFTNALAAGTIAKR